MLIMPFFFAIILFVMVVAFLAVSASLATATIAAQAVSNTQASKYIKYVVIVGGFLSFVASWWFIGPVTDRGIEATLTYSLKLAVCAAFSAAALAGAAIALRTLAYLSNHSAGAAFRNPYSFLAAALAGLLIGNGSASVGLGYLNNKNGTPAPISLAFGAGGTHCVNASRMRFHKGPSKNHEAVISLDRGDRLRLSSNPTTGWNRFVIEIEGEKTVVYGLGSDNLIPIKLCRN